MAKLNALQLLNQVLQNIGENTVSDLTSLSGIKLLAWDALNEVILDLATDDHWRPLEATGTTTLLTDTYTYTEPSDILGEPDKDSFRVDDKSDSNIELLTPQEWDALYPEGIGTSKTGQPTKVTRYGSVFIYNKRPTASENGKIVYFRYWSIPSLLSTATSTGTCWIPEGFDRTVLVNLATFKVLHYKQNEEAAVYSMKVYGSPNEKLEGSLDKMRKAYRSPILKPRVTYVF